MPRADAAANARLAEPPATHALSDDFRALIGASSVWEAAGRDAVDGVPARIVVEPGTVEEVSAVLRLANERGLRVIPRGNGTALGLGNPPERVDVILSMKRLTRILEYSPGDLVVRAEAGLRLGTAWGAEESAGTAPSLQREMAGAGQMLALDSPGGTGCTLGGLVACNAAGPWRARYGTVRDLLIGITVVLADGTIARAGGKVVKNVAGYDLAKLYTGSLGTLGVIAETTWRLHPRPAAARVLTVRLPGLARMDDLIRDLATPALDPSGMQLLCSSTSPDAEMLVLLEGIERGVRARLATARAITERYGGVEAHHPAGAWSRTDGPVHPDGDPAALDLKVTSPPSSLTTALTALLEIAAAKGLEVRVVGQPLVGTVHATAAGGSHAAYAEAVDHLRRAAAAWGGIVTVMRAPLGTKRLIDVWGPVGDALPLMRRVKERFDPKRTLNPGRLVGGI